MRILHKGEYEEIHIQELSGHGYVCISRDQKGGFYIWFPDVILSIILEDATHRILPLDYDEMINGYDIWHKLKHSNLFYISKILTICDIEGTGYYEDKGMLQCLIEEADNRGVCVRKEIYDYLETLKKS